jgi:sugar/nucleoside kinase (ribokinase family)
VSAVSVVESTGDRSVVSLDAVNSDASPPGDLDDLVAGADVVLVDGHHPLIAHTAARLAAARETTLVVDAGRWKPAMSDVLPYATDMVCSNDFRVPGADDAKSTAAALVRSGVRTVVTTHGGEPIDWWSGGESGSVPVEPVVVVDTLGAGDAFHGAYSYFSTQAEGGIAERIDRSARVAALRCSVVGPRAWLSVLRTELHVQRTEFHVLRTEFHVLRTEFHTEQTRKRER